MFHASGLVVVHSAAGRACTTSYRAVPLQPNRQKYTVRAGSRRGSEKSADYMETNNQVAAASPGSDGPVWATWDQEDAKQDRQS